MGFSNFFASTGFVCRWAKRHLVRSNEILGAAASADHSGAVAEKDALFEALRGVNLRPIYNMDERRLFYRCIPYRSYVFSRKRRTARGFEAMRAKDRVPAVLCMNADWSRKLPIALIGKAARPQCFRPPAAPCPVPYFCQTNAWMDGPTKAAWSSTVFVAEVRRVTTEPVYVIMDNAPSHEFLQEDGMTAQCRPPNTTSICLPLEMVVISAIKRRYKPRFHCKVLQDLRSQLGGGAASGGGGGSARCVGGGAVRGANAGAAAGTAAGRTGAHAAGWAPVRRGRSSDQRQRGGCG